MQVYCRTSVAQAFWHSGRIQWRRDFLKKPLWVVFAEVWAIKSVHWFSVKNSGSQCFPAASAALLAKPAQMPRGYLCCTTAPVYLHSILSLHIQDIVPAECRVLWLWFFLSGSFTIMSAAWYYTLNRFCLNYSDTDQTALTWLRHGCDIQIVLQQILCFTAKWSIFSPQKRLQAQNVMVCLDVSNLQDSILCKLNLTSWAH